MNSIPYAYKIRIIKLTLYFTLQMTTLDHRGILESDIDAIIFSRSASLPVGGVRDVRANNLAPRREMACSQLARPTSLTSSIQSLLSGERMSAFAAYCPAEQDNTRRATTCFSTSPPTAFTALPPAPQQSTRGLRSFVGQAPVVKITDHSHLINGPCSPDSGRG